MSAEFLQNFIEFYSLKQRVQILYKGLFRGRCLNLHEAPFRLRSACVCLTTWQLQRCVFHHFRQITAHRCRKSPECRESPSSIQHTTDVTETFKVIPTFLSFALIQSSHSSTSQEPNTAASLPVRWVVLTSSLISLAERFFFIKTGACSFTNRTYKMLVCVT